MKTAKVIPLHKGDSVLVVSNYRPISILPILSKIFERLIVNMNTQTDGVDTYKMQSWLRNTYNPTQLWI